MMMMMIMMTMMMMMTSILFKMSKVLISRRQKPLENSAYVGYTDTYGWRITHRGNYDPRQLNGRPDVCRNDIFAGLTL